MNRTKILVACCVLVPMAAFLAPAALAAGQSVRRGKPTQKRAVGKAEILKTAPGTSGARYAGEPISLDLKDADLKDVLRTFAELTKLNIAIDPDVKGSVTLRLHEVPWDQALDVILKINGLGYVLEGNILRVGTPARLLAED
jgi:type II secretory pathway component HofQ